MSISKECVLDDDGMPEEIYILHKASSPHRLDGEEGNLDQFFRTEIESRTCKTRKAIFETYINYREHANFPQKMFYSVLRPLIRVAKEHDKYVQKMFDSFKKSSEVTRMTWEQERKERDWDMERESKFSNYLGSKRWIFTIKELEDAFETADRNSELLWSRGLLAEGYKKMYRMYAQKFWTQRDDFEQCQKKCAELEARNKQLMKRLNKSEAKVRNANFCKKSEENVSRKRHISNSVQTDKELEDFKTVELIKKLCFPFLGSKNNGAEAAKKVPNGMKSEVKLWDHRVESDLLNNGQGVAEVKKREASTEGLVDESGFIDYACYEDNKAFNGYIDNNDFSMDPAKGIAEESGIVLWNEEKSSDGFQRSLSGFHSQQNVQRRKKKVQGVVKGFEVLSKCQKEWNKQYCEVIEESKISNSFENQSVVKESKVLLPSVHSSLMLPESTCQKDSKHYETEMVSEVTDESIAYVKLDDHISEASVRCDTNDVDVVEVLKEEPAKGSAVKSSNIVSQKYIEDTSGIKSNYVKSSEVEASEQSQRVRRTKIRIVTDQQSLQTKQRVPETIKRFKAKEIVPCGLVVRTEGSTHLKMAGLEKQGDVACGVVLQKKTKRRKQEEPRPRTDPPKSTTSSVIQNDSVSKSGIQYTSALRKSNEQSDSNHGRVSTRTRIQSRQKESSSSSDCWSDNDSIRAKEKPHPGKDPPVALDYKDSQCTRLHQEFRPRKDPPNSCQLQYAEWSQMEGLHMPSTPTWSQFAIVVH